jgi:P-type conjugative transfer protein TrbJ
MDRRESSSSWGDTMRTRGRPRGVLAAMAALVFAVPLEAQFGIPQVVYDPQAAASARLHYVQFVRQTATQIDQLRKSEETIRTLRNEARRFTRVPLVSFVTRQSAFDRLFASPTGLGFNNPSLDRIFRAAFPEARISDPLRPRDAAQQNLVRRAAYALVMGSGQQGAQLRDAVQTLENVKRMATAASSQSEIAQAQAAAGVLAVQEAQQARQLQVAAVNQQAAMDAYRISRDAREDSLSALARAKWDVRERQIAELLELWKRKRAVPPSIWRPGAKPPVYIPPTTPTPPGEPAELLPVVPDGRKPVPEPGNPLRPVGEP